MTLADWSSGAAGVLFLVFGCNLVAALALARLRVPYCPECEHCRREDRERKAREEASRRLWEDMKRRDR